MEALNQKLIWKTRPLSKKENVVVSDNYRFTVLTENLIRIEKGNSFLDDATLTFFYRDTDPVKFDFKEENNLVTIKTNALTLFFDKTKKVSENYVIFSKDDEKKYLNNDFNLLGTMRTLDTFYDGGFCVAPNVTDFKIKNLPLSLGILSKNGVSVIDDSKTPTLLDDGLCHERVEEELDIYLFLYNNEYKKALVDFYKISGFTPLIPKFALGNWWSRYHAYTDKEYINTLDKFEYDKVPLSVATIDMDWHYVDTEKKFEIREKGKTDIKKYGELGGWTGYTWNTDLWKNYKESLEEIKERGLHITLNLHPKDGIRWFESMYKDMALSMGKDPEKEEVIEFDMTDPLYINNYFKVVMNPYEKDGVDFWWIDYQQDRTTKIKNLDPLWPLNHYHYLDSPHHLILSRYAELGSHRYPLGFSGDTKQTWDFLKFMPYFTFTASNAGYTWWSHDIGAHHYGEKDDDLYLRWIEFGVFSPINRIHANCMDVVSKEPWLNKTPVKLITEEYLRLRHRLIPYIYNYSHLTASLGRPLIEPLYYEYPEDERCYKEESTYYFGEMVVSPITEKTKDGYVIKKIFLPEGKYYDYFTKRWYKGGRYIEVARDLGEIPLFIEEKSILPLQNDYNNVNSLPKDMEINIISDHSILELDESIDQPFKTLFKSIKEENGDIIFTAQSITDLVFNRKYSFSFRYLLSGDVEVLIDGVSSSFIQRENDNLRVIINEVPVKSLLEIRIKNPERESEKDYMLRQALNELTKYNALNTEKQDVYDLIKGFNTLEEFKDNIKTFEVKDYLKTLFKEITLLK